MILYDFWNIFWQIAFLLVTTHKKTFQATFFERSCVSPPLPQFCRGHQRTTSLRARSSSGPGSLWGRARADFCHMRGPQATSLGELESSWPKAVLWISLLSGAPRARGRPTLNMYIYIYIYNIGLRHTWHPKALTETQKKVAPKSSNLNLK